MSNNENSIEIYGIIYRKVANAVTTIIENSN